MGMGARAGAGDAALFPEFVLGDDADRAVHFQYAQSNVAQIADAVLAHCRLDFLRRDELAPAVLMEDRAVAHDDRGFTLDQLPCAPAVVGDARDDAVCGQEHRGRDDAAGDGCVRSRHGILYGVADHQQQYEIEERHLADLTLPREAHADQQHQIDDDGPQWDRPPWTAECEDVVPGPLAHAPPSRTAQGAMIASDMP